MPVTSQAGQDHASFEPAAPEQVETTEGGVSLAGCANATGELREALRWQAVGTAVKGISHERTGLPCQDAQGFQVLEDGTLIIALADGAGSAQFSDQGARAAVEEALSALAGAAAVLAETSAGLQDLPPTREGWEDLIREVFDAARQSVLQLADEAGEWIRDYACTLTCAVAQGNCLVVGQVGDGAVVAMTEAGELFAATRLQRGEYANETHFLIQDDALDHLIVDVFECPVSALAVMSDGLIRLALKMPAQEPHEPFFQPLFAFARKHGSQPSAADELAGFLRSERVNARTDDDKSLVLAVRQAGEEPPATGE